MTLTLDIEALIAAQFAAIPKPKPMTALELLREKRSSATEANRRHKKAQHEAVLETVSGDREALKTISVWMPRRTKTTMFARGFNREAFAQGGEKFTDLEAEIETVEYDLEQIEVPRAKIHSEEIAIAKLEGRYKEHVPSIQGFFAPKPTVAYAARPNDGYSALGDFEWCDDLVPRHEREAVHARYAAKHNKPVRNINEAAMTF